MTSTKLPNLSESQFPHISNGMNVIIVSTSFVVVRIKWVTLCGPLRRVPGTEQLLEKYSIAFACCIGFLWLSQITTKVVQKFCIRFTGQVSAGQRLQGRTHSLSLSVSSSSLHSLVCGHIPAISASIVTAPSPLCECNLSLIRSLVIGCRTHPDNPE